MKAAAAATGMAAEQSGSAVVNPDGPMKLLFVEMGVGYDQHGIASDAMMPFGVGSIPGVSMEQMKLQIKLGVPHSLQQYLDIDRWEVVLMLLMEIQAGSGLDSESRICTEEGGDFVAVDMVEMTIKEEVPEAWCKLTVADNKDQFFPQEILLVL
ncbi:hypothetical protein LINPERPRIM_LOCUS32588 [Linum perenne]